MSNKIKYGVVSSFDVLCGNATYSEAIATGLEARFEVFRIEIPISFQSAYDEMMLSHLVKQVEKCDIVNIQMELSLYGPTPFIAAKVLKKLIDASSHVIITFHRVEIKPTNWVRQLYHLVKLNKKKELFKTLLKYQVDKVLAQTYRSIVDQTVKKNGLMIVHTEREYKKLKGINQAANVEIHPIIWPDQKVNSLTLDPYYKHKHRVLGLFGFITPYKNYDLVIEALRDQNINLLIAGGTHPQSLDYGKAYLNATRSYFGRLSEKLSLNDYRGRIHVVCSPDDQGLIDLIHSVDIVCIPYSDTGQSASGIYSMAVQYGKQIIVSDISAHREFNEYLNEKPYMFDSESTIGFLSALNEAIRQPKKIQFAKFSFETLINLYALDARPH